MVQYRAILTTADQWKSYNSVSNGATFKHFKRPLVPISRSCRSLTLNISETVRDTDVVLVE